MLKCVQGVGVFVQDVCVQAAALWRPLLACVWSWHRPQPWKQLHPGPRVFSADGASFQALQICSVGPLKSDFLNVDMAPVCMQCKSK